MSTPETEKRVDLRGAAEAGFLLGSGIGLAPLTHGVSAVIGSASSAYRVGKDLRPGIRKTIIRYWAEKDPGALEEMKKVVEERTDNTG